MRTRRLALRRETLTELRTDELARVAGAAVTVPVGGCVVELVSARIDCDSLLRPCISNGCTR